LEPQSVHFLLRLSELASVEIPLLSDLRQVLVPGCGGLLKDGHILEQGVTLGSKGFDLIRQQVDRGRGGFC
jgi:hypothetical protein